MSYTLPQSRAEAAALDAADPLRAACAAFHMPDGVTYLDGHSLGPATHAALRAVRDTAERAWADGLIRSWNTAGWIDLPRTVGARLARLIGAAPHEVIVTDSVSVNLYKLAAAALPLTDNRRIMVEADEFPTDQYVADGLCQLAGADFLRLDPATAQTALQQGGVLLKSVVNYRTAAVADMAADEAAARQGGAFIVWDLSHATGCVDLDLQGTGAQLATGCTYKYLNGGPGAPAFVFASDAIADQLTSPLPGWFGHAAPFAFDPDYRPAAGAARFAAGTPGILSLSALDATLDVFDGIHVPALAAKARALGDVCLWWADQLGLTAISPGIGQVRGGHVSLLHDHGYAVVQALIARGIIPDFRAPDAMRFGFSPLYVTFTQVWDAMTELQDILATRAWDQDRFRVQAKVT